MSDPRVLGMTWIDVQYAVVCADCDLFYDLRASSQCPKCGGTGGALVAKFLQPRTEAALPEHVDGEWRVRLADVLHHVGNGLQPARTHAELVAKDMELRGRIGPHFNHGLEQRIGHAARVIVDAIDNTLARLRALSRPTTTKEEPTHGRHEDH